MLLYLLLLVSAVSCENGFKLPDEYQRCNLSDTNYNECLTNAIENSFTLLREGIPSLDVESIEPLQIPEIIMSQGTGLVVLTLKFINAKIHNFSNIDVLSASNEMQKGGSNITFDIRMPEFTILTNYTIEGHVLFLPISGEGTCKMVFKNVYAEGKMDNEIIKKDGEEYLSVKKFKPRIIPEKLIMKFNNLFGGNAFLGNEMNIFLNENSKQIFQEMRPAIEGSFGEVFKQISNDIFSKVPYKTIFLH